MQDANITSWHQGACSIMAGALGVVVGLCMSQLVDNEREYGPKHTDRELAMTMVGLEETRSDLIRDPCIEWYPLVGGAEGLRDPMPPRDERLVAQVALEAARPEWLFECPDLSLAMVGAYLTHENSEVRTAAVFAMANMAQNWGLTLNSEHLLASLLSWTAISDDEEPIRYYAMKVLSNAGGNRFAVVRERMTEIVDSAESERLVEIAKEVLEGS